MALEPIPPPGLAIFPQFLSTEPQTILMKGEIFGNDIEVTPADGRPFLSVNAKHFSASHKMHFIDTTTGQPICEVRRKKMAFKYYGVNEENGTTLFETEVHFKMSGSTTAIKFINLAAGKAQEAELEFKSQRFSTQGPVIYQGKQVGYMRKKKMSMSGQYELQVAPGVDPFLIVVLAVVVEDKERTRARRTMVIGAANSSGGGG